MTNNNNIQEDDFFEDDFFDDEKEFKPRVWSRSVSNTVIGGVCGGIGEYLHV